MNLAAMLTSLPGNVPSAARQAAALGFDRVDVVGLEERPAADLEALADTGLIVSCAAVGRGLPEGAGLDAEPLERRRAAVEAVKRQLADSARLGATHAYVVPGPDTQAASLRRFADSCTVLAEFAAQRRVRLCVEASPGRALATASGTLDWLQQIDHANLFLLLDIGHCLLSREEPAAVIERAGGRLGYVHLDDNDGCNDVHWPLLTGQLSLATLEAAARALRAVDYAASLSLELSLKNENPVDALRQGKALLEQVFSLPLGEEGVGAG